MTNVSSALNGDDDGLPPAVAKTGRGKNAAATPKVAVPAVEKKVWIKLEDNDKIPPTGQFFSLNGRTWYLKAGVPVLVPEALLNVINDAVESAPVVDEATLKVLDYRERLRFPYQLVKAPREAVAA